MPVVKSRFIRTTQTLETRYLYPWLVFSIDNRSGIYSFVNPMHNNENYLVKFSKILVGATIRYQNGGWLLMSREKELFFYNPFTRETVQLADFPGCHYLSDISFSSLPTVPDCRVFGIDRSGFGGLDISITIYSIRKGEQQWEDLDYDEFDFDDKYSPSRNTPTLKLDLSDDIFEFLEKPRGHFKDSYPSFLVKCGENLLLNGFSKMEWAKVESLGQHMLFISDICCFSAVAPNSQMENKVYFPRLCLDGEGILYYSLETGITLLVVRLSILLIIYLTLRVGIQTALGFNLIGPSPPLKSLTG
ncbi:hypothetical protein MKX01_023399 [Papaver californicum]|nr:hypothetical protein MKX01_023399 [Papaver californicum]